jgi:gluconolactonase
MTARVVTRLPDSMRLKEQSEWVVSNRGGVPTDVFLEGPCYDAQGQLFMVDLAYGRIFKVANGEWSLVVRYDGWPNSLKVLADGMLAVADYKRGLLKIDPANGAITPMLTMKTGENFKGLNDLVIHRDGSIYMTDQGQTGLQDPTGRVFRLSPNGRLDLLLGTGPSPNGIALNKAQNQLYVAMTRASQIWRFAIPSDANTVKVQNFAQLPGGTIGPDGITVDDRDRLYVCDNGHNCVWVLDAKAEPLYRIRAPAGLGVTNCAMTPDGKTVMIVDANSGSILACDMPTS